MDFRRCSKENHLAFSSAAKHELAAISAISVSKSNFLFLEGERTSTTSGMPLSSELLRKGFGGSTAPTIGRSRALENVEQLGAQCETEASRRFSLSETESTKTSLPRNKSQGGNTLAKTLLTTWLVWVSKILGHPSSPWHYQKDGAVPTSWSRPSPSLNFWRCSLLNPSGILQRGSRLFYKLYKVSYSQVGHDHGCGLWPCLRTHPSLNLKPPPSLSSCLCR